MKRKTLEKITALVCSFVMILAIAFTFISAPADAGNILYLTGTERDPVLTGEQLEKLCDDVVQTYSVNAERRAAQLVAENNEKQAILNQASADMLRLKAELDAEVASFNAFDDEWNNMFRSVHDEPAYQEALAAKDEELLLATALELIGKTREEYDAYLAELEVRNARVEALAEQYQEAKMTVAIYAPAPAQ